jgi:hypothetical protein
VFMCIPLILLCVERNYMSLFFLLVRPSLFSLVLITAKFRFIVNESVCLLEAMHLYQVKNAYLPKLLVNTYNLGLKNEQGVNEEYSSCLFP